MHENKSLREYSTNVKGDDTLTKWWIGERNKVPELFGRTGRLYDYSCSAILYVSSIYIIHIIFFQLLISRSSVVSLLFVFHIFV